MTAKNVLKLVYGALLTACLMGGCECQGDANQQQSGNIGPTPIAKEKPDAPRPATVFPWRAHTEDMAVNAFIDEMLEICAEGDYGGFRALFGTAYTPTPEDKFRRVWHGVQEIRIEAVEPDRSQENVFYGYAEIRLRKPDRDDQTMRQMVVMIYRQGEKWRLGPAPKEIEAKFLAAAATRPAEPGGAAGGDP